MAEKSHFRAYQEIPFPLIFNVCQENISKKKFYSSGYGQRDFQEIMQKFLRKGLLSIAVDAYPLLRVSRFFIWVHTLCPGEAVLEVEVIPPPGPVAGLQWTSAHKHSTGSWSHHWSRILWWKLANHMTLRLLRECRQAHSFWLWRRK